MFAVLSLQMFEFLNLLRKCFFHSSYWSKKAKVSMKNLTNDLVVPIIRETDFEMDLLVMGFQEFKNTWTSWKRKIRNTYETWKQRRQICSCCHRRKSFHCWSFNGRQNSKICKNNFLLLARSPYDRWNVRPTSKAINQGNGQGMKVPCIPAFTG